MVGTNSTRTTGAHREKIDAKEQQPPRHSTYNRTLSSSFHRRVPYISNGQKYRFLRNSKTHGEAYVPRITMQTSEGNSSKYPIPTVRAKRRYPSTERLILSLEASQAFTERTFFASQDTPLPPLAPETRIGGVKGTEQRNRPMGGMARIPLAPNASQSKEHLGAEYLISIPHRPPTRTERHASLCARSLSRRAFATGNTQRYPIFYARFFAI